MPYTVRERWPGSWAVIAPDGRPLSLEFWEEGTALDMAQALTMARAKRQDEAMVARATGT